MSGGLEEYRAEWHRTHARLREVIARHPHLREVLNSQWDDRVDQEIRQLAGPRRLPNSEFQLLRILGDPMNDGERLIPRLNTAIATLESEASGARKLRPLRETLGKLSGRDVNQIQSAVFELIVLHVFVKAAHGHGIDHELFPSVGSGQSNVEFMATVNERRLWMEAKALGYSSHDYLSDQSGTFYHGVATQQKQIDDAVNEKTRRGKQLGCASSNDATILCLALGHNAMSRMAEELLNDHFRRSNGLPSAILLFGGFQCRVAPRVFENPGAKCPLTDRERAFLSLVHG